MGSVKDLVVQREPTERKLGLGTFVFSDRYSVFDWGEMPDLIPRKGEVLAVMGAYNFELLEEKGIETHYRGLGDPEEVYRLEESRSPDNRMSVVLAHKPVVEYREGQYHYEDLSDRDNFLIPLEIVFRNYVPPGSSIRSRYGPEELGLDYQEWPDDEIEFEDPMVEFSTKLEKQDRYLSLEDAFKISGLTEEEFSELSSVAKKVNRYLTDHARETGFKHLDGKIECIYDRGKIIVADVTGTFDENRFSYEGVQISKEVLRQWYKDNDREWYEQVVAAKERAKKEDVTDWTELVERSPRELDPELLDLVADLYGSGLNRWLGKSMIDSPEISTVLEELQRWRAKKN